MAETSKPPSVQGDKRPKITTHTLLQMKERGEHVTMLTCYDATFARLVEAAGVEVILVGDSLGMVIQGHANTLPVTVEDVLYHARAVRRGAPTPLLVADMPFRSYQVSVEEAVRNGTRFLAEAGAEAVKLEGGTEYVEVVRALVRASVPVMGHIGLTPQSVHALGGYKVQGKTEGAARKLVADAVALEEAGCFAIVLEGMPSDVAQRVTEAVHVPTIGIGAGAACDGQVLVLYDLLGLDESFKPKFVKRYAQLAGAVEGAVRAFRDEVRAGSFPDAAHSFGGGPGDGRLRALYGGKAER
ncbi:MAG TPA: 3-methyl-2-oxobutanoate hydroxymethyltransferase [Myxococcota bacterium]|jgi:3-methyl-2-oxobutanoate hydroxymethyltransferase|nr:3-methyl-2-oxobutanoate hydroxymethyltransferase [Myxococcota bacterium]